MRQLSKGWTWCRRKTGLSEQMILWSFVALGGLLLFSILFTYPLSRKTKQLYAENALKEARLKELVLWETLDLQLNKILKTTYPQIKGIPVNAFKEEGLLELPSRIGEFAASMGVTLVSIDPRSVQDGAKVSIRAVFQGDMKNLYALLQGIGRVSYAERLDSISILALPDGEQMELKFKVPIQ